MRDGTQQVVVGCSQQQSLLPHARLELFTASKAVDTPESSTQALEKPAALQHKAGAVMRELDSPLQGHAMHCGDANREATTLN